MTLMPLVIRRSPPSSLDGVETPERRSIARSHRLVLFSRPSLAEQGVSRGVQWFQSRDWRRQAAFMSAVRRNDSDARAHFYWTTGVIDNDLSPGRICDARSSSRIRFSYHCGMQGYDSASHASAESPARDGVKTQLEVRPLLAVEALDASECLVDYYRWARHDGGGRTRPRSSGGDSRLDGCAGLASAIATRSKTRPP